MEDRPVPSGNWLRMHRGWGPRPKIRHRAWLGAWWHLQRARRRYKAHADLLSVYPCWFTDDNGFGRRHWHIGHTPGARKAQNDKGLPKPRNGTLMIGVFSVPDGFEVREFIIKPAICHPAEITPEAALKAYLEAE